MIIILISIFIIFSLIAFIPISNKKVREVILYCMAFVLILISAFRGAGVDRDYNDYVQYFKDSDFQLVEPAFVIISRIIKLFTSNAVFLFLVFAFLGVSLKIKAIKQLSELWLLCIVTYASYFFILHEMTQIRAGIASAFLLLCIKPIYERDWKKFLLFAFLAVSIHYSALVILPFWFLSRKPYKFWLAISIPLAYLVYFTHIDLIAQLPIPGIKEKIEIYKGLQDLGNDEWNKINVFNLLFLAKVAIFYFVLWKYDLISAKNKYTPILLKVFCISLVFFLIFATMPVIAFRLNELCGIVDIILIPSLFYAFKPTWFAKAIVIVIGLGLMFIILFYNKLIVS